MVRSVRPLSSSHRRGIGNSSGTSRPLAASRTPSVAIAVGSGAMPKTSALRPWPPEERRQERIDDETNDREQQPEPAGDVPPVQGEAAACGRRSPAASPAGRRPARIGDRPVDRRIAVPQEGPAHEGPERGEDERDPRTSPWATAEARAERWQGRRRVLRDATARMQHCAARTCASRRAGRRAEGLPAGRPTIPTSRDPGHGPPSARAWPRQEVDRPRPPCSRAHGRRGWWREWRR